jgi:hypothetical protein
VRIASLLRCTARMIPPLKRAVKETPANSLPRSLS